VPPDGAELTPTADTRLVGKDAAATAGSGDIDALEEVSDVSGRAYGEWGGPCHPGYPEAESCYPYYCTPTRFGAECMHITGQDVCTGGRRTVLVGSRPGDGIWMCVFMDVLYGQPCSSDADCWVQTAYGALGKYWITWGCTWSDGEYSVRQCTSHCTANHPCPHPSTSCPADPGSPWKTVLCRPDEPLACPRSAFLMSSTGPCKRSNAFGTCTGTARCEGYGPEVLPTCDAPEPASETCALSGGGDGVDQDCDGKTDEGCTP